VFCSAADYPLQLFAKVMSQQDAKNSKVSQLEVALLTGLDSVLNWCLGVHGLLASSI